MPRNSKLFFAFKCLILTSASVFQALTRCDTTLYVSLEEVSVRHWHHWMLSVVWRLRCVHLPKRNSTNHSGVHYMWYYVRENSENGVNHAREFLFMQKEGYRDHFTKAGWLYAIIAPSWLSDWPRLGPGTVESTTQLVFWSLCSIWETLLNTILICINPKCSCIYQLFYIPFIISMITINMPFLINLF